MCLFARYRRPRRSLRLPLPTRRPRAKKFVAGAMKEASQRFLIPVAWLRAVVRAESHGDARSQSKKGAIGLTQVMPATYEELRIKHGLGIGPGAVLDAPLAEALREPCNFRNVA